MKTLALRAVALIALGLFAHTVKPFTTENIAAYALASAHSFVAWLPDTALARWERTAVLASVIGQAWTNYADTDQPNWRMVMASNIQSDTAALANTTEDTIQPQRLKNKTRRKLAKPSMTLPASNQAPALITESAPMISWQSEEVVEPSTIPHEGEPTASPIAPIAPIAADSTKTFTLQFAPALPAAAAKRAACEIPTSPAAAPTPTQEAEMLETAPVTEPDSMPTMTPARPQRSGNMLEIQIQPVRYRLSPAQRRQSPNQEVQKSLTKC